MSVFHLAIDGVDDAMKSVKAAYDGGVVLVVGAIEIIEVNPVSITVGLKVTDDTEDGGVSAGAWARGNHDPVDDRPLSRCELENRIAWRMREVSGEDVFASDGEWGVLRKK
jgi:hypothetical protein